MGVALLDMHADRSFFSPNRMCRFGAWFVFLAIVASCSEVPPVQASENASAQAAQMRDAIEGTLFFRTEREGQFKPAPTLKTDVSMKVTGMVLRAIVRQEFLNHHSEWAEGVYVFPLPEDAAVDHLRLRIGERIIEGQIKERAKAKRTYVQAKSEGKRASLLEQERPNIFTASVANIGPGETITVELEYQQTVRYDQGRFQLRFPMVVGPRYIPGKVVTIKDQIQHVDGLGWAFDTDQVPDASRMTPPVQPPGKGLINPVSITIDLAPGFPLARLESGYHAIQASSEPDGRHVIRLQEGEAPADRDFELLWEPAPGRAPQAALFTEHQEGVTYGLVMILPPVPSTLDRADLPREIVFVIDTSGSMHGTSIEQAKAALILALGRLSPHDRFNIMQFNNVTQALFHKPQQGTRENRDRAIRYVKHLHANGGTEMLAAMKLALDGAEHAARLRQVIFLTDGQIGNEAALFDTIHRRLGDSRLFTIGIGSAPNSYFMRRAAEFGRGTFTYIAKSEEVKDKVDELLHKLDHPALTDIQIDRAGWEQAEIIPARVPDLYLGEPVIVAVRANQLSDHMVLRGRIGKQLWEREVQLDQARSREGVATYWARQKIASLMAQQTSGQPPDTQRDAVIDVALRHHLVSKYTSLVAIDVTPARPTDAKLNRHALKTNLPHGQDYTAIFGLPQTATPARVQITLGLLLLLLAGGLYQFRRQGC